MTVLATVLSVAASAAGAGVQIAGDGARIADAAGRVEITVDLTQSTAWRVRTLAAPARLVLDVADLDWIDLPDISSASVSDVRVGRYQPGWSRMVVVLREPLAVDTAEMQTEETSGAKLKITLRPTTAEEFRALAAESEAEPSRISAPVPPVADGKIRVVLDPGHGGIDPGAEHSGIVEADLMLAFARSLKDRLLRSGRFDVLLTRDEDFFVPLETRLGLAQAAGADVFVSLHADSLAKGAAQTSGVTAYTLSDDTSDDAATQLAERHAADAILSGVDLSGAGDDVTLALIELAQRDTSPRSEALAATLVMAVASLGLETNSRPHRHGGFSVLKSPEIPSVLLELGYMSHPGDRDRLLSETWQAKAEQAIVDGLLLWWDEDRLRRDGRFR